MSLFHKSAFLPLAVAVSWGCSGAAPAPAVTPDAEKPAEEPQKDPRYSSLPTPKPAPVWAPPAAKKTTLENGLTVWEMGGASAPLVSIHLMLPTGGNADPKGKEGLSLLTADMLDEGAGKLDALALSDRLGELATDYSARASVDYVLLSMDALTENLPESLALLADIVRRPKLSKEEFERRKKHHVAEALSDRDDPESSQAKAIHFALFGEGYAGSPSSGTTSSLESITLADVKRHAKRMTVPEGAHLTIAGMFDADLVNKAVQDAFGDWKGKLTKEKAEIAKAPGPQQAFVVDFPGASQSALAAVIRSGSDRDANYFAEEVLSEKLGRGITSRINMNLREDKGYTYGAHSVYGRYQEAGYFAILGNVKTETTGASVHEIFGELEALCGARPLSDKERNEAVDGLLLGYPMLFDQVGALGSRLAALPVHDRSVDFWQKWPEEMNAVTTQKANAAAAPLCKTENFSIIVAGDAAQVTPALEKLGLKVQRLDRDGRPLDAEEKVKKAE